MGYNNTRSQGGKGAMPPPKFLENMAILWFERRFSKQNRVIRLNSKFCPPQISLLATPLGIIHSTTSPGHQFANGKAEAAVKSVKNMLKRTSHDNSDQFIALLEMRNSPRQDVNRSPAQIVFGHFTHSELPAFLKPCTALDVRKRLTRRHQTKQCYDRHARPFKTLHANQHVYFQHPPRNRWTRGTIVRRIGPHSHIVKSIDGSTYKRNRVHICPFNSPDPSHSEPQYYNTSIPVPFVSHCDVTCDSHAVPVNTQPRPVSSNAEDSSCNNNSRPQRAVM